MLIYVSHRIDIEREAVAWDRDASGYGGPSASPTVVATDEPASIIRLQSRTDAQQAQHDQWVVLVNPATDLRRGDKVRDRETDDRYAVEDVVLRQAAGPLGALDHKRATLKRSLA